MIYILRIPTDYDSYSKRLFEVPDGYDVEKEYKKKMLSLAESLGLVINPHWYNLMNRENHHPQMSAVEYTKACKLWNRMLKESSMCNFLSVVGVEIGFKEVYES